MGNCQNSVFETTLDNGQLQQNLPVMQQKQSFRDSNASNFENSNKNVEKFYVITCIFTPTNTSAKLEMYRKFSTYMRHHGIQLITIEFTTMAQPFLATEPFLEPFNFQMRVQHAINLKYNLINLILQKLPAEQWGWLAMIDYNIEFDDDTWLEKATEAMEHNQIVQLFSQASVFSHKSDISSSNDESKSNRCFENDTFIKKYQKNSILSYFQLIDFEKYGLFELSQLFESGRAFAFRKDFVQQNQNSLMDICFAGFDELFLCLCLQNKCSQLCQNLLSTCILQYIKQFEAQFFDQKVTFACLKNVHIKCYDIVQSDCSLRMAIEFMNRFFDQISRDGKGVYIISGIEYKEQRTTIQSLAQTLL